MANRIDIQFNLNAEWEMQAPSRKTQLLLWYRPDGATHSGSLAACTWLSSLLLRVYPSNMSLDKVPVSLQRSLLSRWSVLTTHSKFFTIQRWHFALPSRPSYYEEKNRRTNKYKLSHTRTSKTFLGTYDMTDIIISLAFFEGSLPFLVPDVRVVDRILLGEERLEEKGRCLSFTSRLR